MLLIRLTLDCALFVARVFRRAAIGRELPVCGGDEKLSLNHVAECGIVVVRERETFRELRAVRCADEKLSVSVEFVGVLNFRAECVVAHVCQRERGR